MNILGTHTHMLSWKMQFLPHISSPSSQIWKIQRQKVVFLRQTFCVPTTLCYPENAVFTTYILSQVVIFGKFQDYRGSLSQYECPEYPHPYVILKNAVFLSHISFPSSWIWKFLTRTAFLKTPGLPTRSQTPLRQRGLRVVTIYLCQFYNLYSLNGLFKTISQI